MTELKSERRKLDPTDEARYDREYAKYQDAMRNWKPGFLSLMPIRPFEAMPGESFLEFINRVENDLGTIVHVRGDDEIIYRPRE